MRSKIKSNKKIKKQTSKKTLLELPNDILFRIVDEAGVYHRQKIRASCRRLKTICDGQLLHDFRKALNQRRGCEKFSYQALEAIDIMSRVYVRTGLESVFAGTLISFVKKSYRTPFLSDHKTLKAFMRNFLKLADQQAPGQRGRLLYSLMILNILNNFKSFSIMSSEEIPNRMWKLECEIQGCWFSKHSMGSKITDDQLYDTQEFPIQLLDLLISANMNKPYKNLYESKKHLYYYGNDIRKVRTPKTTFTFIVYGPQSIIDILKKPLEAELVLPVDEFDVSIKIVTKGKIDFGFQKENVLELKPDKSSDYMLSSKF